VGQKRLVKIGCKSLHHDPGTGILAKTGWWCAGSFGFPCLRLHQLVVWSGATIVRQLSTAILTVTAEGRLKPVDADDTCMLMLELADGTPCQVCISVPSRARHWLEVYGDRGTLVLGSDNQKITSMVFASGRDRRVNLAEVQIPGISSNLPDGRIAPFIRVVELGARNCSRRGTGPQEGIYSVVDLTHESDATGCWVHVPDLNAFLAVSS